MKKKDIYNKAKATWGIDAQVTKAIEELSELQKELCKFLLDDGTMKNIIEEIADVKVMIEQLELIFECKDKVKLIKKAKIKRLMERLEKEKPSYLTIDCNECKYIYCENVCNRCQQYSQFKKAKIKRLSGRLCSELEPIKYCEDCKYSESDPLDHPCYHCKENCYWQPKYAE